MASFPRRGEIWQVHFPDEQKERPALIVSTDVRNEYSNSVLAVPLTTNLRPLPTHVLLPRGQGGLSHDSMARCENVTLVSRDRLRRGDFELTISPALMAQIEYALSRALGFRL